MHANALRSLDAIFAGLGTPATYAGPDAAPAVACRVLVKTPDQWGDGRGPVITHFARRTSFVEVRVAELAAVAAGGRFIILGETYRVDEPPTKQDGLRLVWTCACVVTGEA